MVLLLKFTDGFLESGNLAERVSLLLTLEFNNLSWCMCYKLRIPKFLLYTNKEGLEVLQLGLGLLQLCFGINQIAQRHSKLCGANDEG